MFPLFHTLFKQTDEKSTNISIEPYGNISITAKFDNCSDLKNFETKSKSIFSDVQGSFHLVQN